ncbi:phosphopantetheine-binding protein [Streptomyces sp. NPDC006326]|uniref:phosphopantetheine-binding protein n=1 Tax=Streptomyces sp. NPDC006326 TaxID=3156752 RepID=UPI0033A72A0B
MNLGSLDDFHRLLHDEFNLDLRAHGPGIRLADLPQWDSVLLLQLITLIEEQTGRRLPVRPILEAATIEDIHALVKEQE